MVGGKSNPEMEAAIAQLQRWDPNNAVPYLLEAEYIRWTRQDTWPEAYGPAHKTTAFTVARLEHEQQWRAAMEKAFAAPRYDEYWAQLQQLNRNVLPRYGSLQPLEVLRDSLWQPQMNYLEISQFSDVLLTEGDQAMSAGELNKARDLYQQAAAFGQRKREQAKVPLDFAGMSIQGESDKRLLTLLPRMNRNDELTAVRNALVEMRRDLKRFVIVDFTGIWEMLIGPVTVTGIMVSISSATLILAFVMTLLVLFYLVSKDVFHFSSPKLIDSLARQCGKFASLVMFVSCVLLYVAYHPFMRRHSAAT